MTYPTFYDPHLAAPKIGQTYELTGPEAHHAQGARRIRVGEMLDVVDGRGTRVRGTVTGVEKGSLRLGVEEVTIEEPPAVRILLVQALAKGGRDEAAIEAATEVGVDGVIAWEPSRSVSRWRGEKERKGLARWEAILTAAMKQSRRSHLPTLYGFARGNAVTDLLPPGAHVLVLHESATRPVTGVELPTGGTIAVVVGPEGGLTDAEVDLLTGRAHAASVLLGREVVRTSTAGPAAIAVLNARLGRW